MPDPTRNDKPDRDSRRQPEFKIPPRTWIVWMIVITGIMTLLVFRDNLEPTKAAVIPANEFLSLVDSNLIAAGAINFDPQSVLKEISGTHYVQDGKGGLKTNAQGVAEVVTFRTKILLTDKLIEQLQATRKFSEGQPNLVLMNLLWTLVPILILGALIYFFFIRQIRSAGKGALSFGKSKARLLSKDRNKTTFKDVAGVEEAIEEVSELVEFLKDPKKFQRLGGRIPKGVLMIGPPGTGKTLLARAIAGEADAAFFSISGSDFVEMFVGVGASRVRDMFEQARKNTPCLIFIDEIDAVGRSRGHGLGGGNDEREQTLNALLVEMDGFDTTDGIIIIAATNRPDVLDPALLRPGRFDRQVTVNLPDVRGREAILKVHAKNVKLAPKVDLSVLARGTPGYSGAELANVLNEAALLASRRGRKSVGMAELEEARDKVRWGRERRSLAMSEEEKRATAWHEAGHALVGIVLEHTHPLHKVTIIPRGQALGAAMYLPERDVLSHKRKQIVDQITMAMAGRIAEEMVTDDVSSGASSDIQQATAMARAMITQWGMSEKLGMVQYGNDDEYVFLGRDMGRTRSYSEATAREIDSEVKRVIDECYATAKEALLHYRPQLEVLANALLEYETLDGAQVQEIIRTGTFTPPPPTPEFDPPTGAQAATPLPEVPPKPTPPKLPGLGSAAPAPV